MRGLAVFDVYFDPSKPDGARRIVYRTPEKDIFIVVKLFNGLNVEDDAPYTFKVWRTKSIMRTVGFWSTKTRVTDKRVRESSIEWANHLLEDVFVPALSFLIPRRSR